MIVVVSAAERPVPAVRLAELHDVSSSYLAKQLQALSRAGLIRAAQGYAGGYELARPADEITVLDVVEAVDGPQPAFTCTEIRQRGPLATPPEVLPAAVPDRPGDVGRRRGLARIPARGDRRRPGSDR